MILVDTSIWIDHLRTADPVLTKYLDDGQVHGHPWITGEIALGSIADRETVLSQLSRLPQAVVVTHEEILHLVDARGMHSRGIGYVDVQLLASARLTGDVVWTRDKRLYDCAVLLGVAL